MLTLRPYQRNQMLIPCMDAFRSGAHGVLLVAPCGSGKTVVFCVLAEAVRNKGKNILILVHRQELLDQASRKLTESGVEHGLIAPGKTKTLDHVQVASVQTLVRRLGSIPVPDLIICDEAHHLLSENTWGKVSQYYNKSLILGVTATPIRHDGKPLGRSGGGFFDVMIQGPQPKELIDQGFLSPSVVYAPPSLVDMSGIHSRFNDYAQNELSDRVDRPIITGDAIKHYRRICPGVPAIVFCVSVKHAENVAAEFNAAGIPAASIDGKLDDRLRKYRIDGLGNGRIKIITACSIISEGTDIPVVTAAIFLRPTKSLGLYIQQAGRALRPFIGKPCSYLLDHVGNVHQHGMIDEIREWSLDGENNGKLKNKQETADAYRQCMKCYAVYPAYRNSCPQCGAVHQPKIREIEQVDGELVKIDPYRDAMETHLNDLRQEQERRQKQIEVHRARSLEDLLNIARNRGYKLAWAYRIWGMRQTGGKA